MVWGHTDPIARSWLARLHGLRARVPHLRNELIAMIQHTQQLYDDGKRAEALQVMTDAERHISGFSNEVDEVVERLQSRGVKAFNLEDVTVPVERAREDLDRLAIVLRE